ncbi:PD-(D/E)XK nuclease-like domain-containing protein [Nocardia sp. CA-145437]|uniref:PD-(D/E)XK nuclease-like domain-containing protein n=1 Tax=Nocardia sp. CA-145437 TaxID=3239980 RepID=UPI003D98E0C2
MSNQLVAGIPDTEYHASPALSSSGARRLLQVAPAQWHWEREHPLAPTDDMEFGSAVHSLTLLTGAPAVDTGHDKWNTNAIKDEIAQIRAEGGIPMRPKEFAVAQAMAKAARAHPRLGVALQHGEPELSGWWHDSETGVECRVRPDALYRPHGDRGPALALDLKTSNSADPTEFARSVVKYGYHAQHAWYVDGLAAHGIDAAFVFLVVSKVAPYLTAAVELVPAAVDLGRRRNREALAIYKRCTESGEWPGYGPDIHQIDVPAWAYKEEIQ